MSLGPTSLREQLMRWAMVAVIVGALGFLFMPQFLFHRHVREVQAGVHRVREVGSLLERYAGDHAGRYPFLAEGETTHPTANQYLSLLLGPEGGEAPGGFWVKGSPVCKRRAPDPQRTRLGPGDCHWAYLSGQSKTDHAMRPLLIDPFLPGTTGFDPELWDRKVIIAKIDGSAQVHRMRLSDGKVLDGSNHDILSSEADAWEGSGKEPSDLLVQPEPAPR